MTISNPDIVTILRQRIDQCRCLSAVPATRCCGGCEHDIRCLTEIVRLRAERDAALHGESDTMTEDEKVIEHLRSCDKHPERVSMYTFDNAIECIKQLRESLNDARREVSELKANEANRLSSAVRLKGWICFEETP
jgi:hypothetical protein